MWRLSPLPLLPLLLHTAGLSLAGGDDRFFPKYHARLHAGHNNDPNGPMRYNGVYHLFLQQTFPWDQDWNGGIGWGHLVSRDLAHWQEIGKYTGFVDPLVPGRWLDPVYGNPTGGYFTGSATVVNGKPALIFPGVWGKGNVFSPNGTGQPSVGASVHCQHADTESNPCHMEYQISVPLNLSDPNLAAWSKPKTIIRHEEGLQPHGAE
jgi:sucrose-6-phosphate hydrolase SacC (GH32 family)